MDTVTFLEYLASHAHHKRKIDLANIAVTDAIKWAISTKNADILKRELSANSPLADMTTIFK